MNDTFDVVTPGEAMTLFVAQEPGPLERLSTMASKSAPPAPRPTWSPWRPARGWA